jgi:SAM-dependent methyltransferase
MIDPDVVAHYEMGLEGSRLFRGGRPRLEYVRTLELLGRFLPPPPAKVLDVGGGTGVYAVPLAHQGYKVHVVDPIQLHVDKARDAADEFELSGVIASVGDARDLAAFREGFDATLLLGPLYHLPDRSDRVLAFEEAMRATRPSGVVIAVGISRFASLIDGLKRRILGDVTFRAIVEQDLTDGVHRNPDVVGHPEWFTTAYMHLPDELRGEAQEAGLKDVSILSVEGPGWIVEDPDDLDLQLFAARRTESEPALLCATSHMMVIGRTPRNAP